jgi:hypothetical protein
MDFLIVALISLTDVFNNFLNETASILPGVIGAIIVIIIGVIVGWGVGKIVNRLVDRTVEKSFDKSRMGHAFRSAGFDLDIQGPVGTFLVQIAAYLPRLLGGILVIVLGIVFVDFLATLIGTTIRPMFGENKTEIADMLRNLLFIGLVAVILNIAFDLLLLTAGGLVYSLIIGFVIIGAGIALTDGLIKSITDDHKEFLSIAGYAKFILYAIFLLIGAGAIFSSFSGVTSIVGNIAWGFAIALAIVLIPIVYTLARRMNTESK